MCGLEAFECCLSFFYYINVGKTIKTNSADFQKSNNNKLVLKRRGALKAFASSLNFFYYYIYSVSKCKLIK